MLRSLLLQHSLPPLERRARIRVVEPRSPSPPHSQLTITLAHSAAVARADQTALRNCLCVCVQGQ